MKPNFLKQIQTPYIDSQTLLTFFHGYQKPREKILRLVKNQELIRLKNGFYLITEKIEKNGFLSPPYEQIANLLYGPSYVSLEWALSFYGLIPEKVQLVTSVCLGRNKFFATSLKNFSYMHLAKAYYPLGVTQKKESQFLGNFFLATAEKALIDFVYFKFKNLNEKEFAEQLFESHRFDSYLLKEMNQAALKEIASYYRCKKVKYLVKLVSAL